jgi:hypothetical protein
MSASTRPYRIESTGLGGREHIGAVKGAAARARIAPI